MPRRPSFARAVERPRARNKRNHRRSRRRKGDRAVGTSRSSGALTASMSFYFRARSSSPTRRVRRRACIRSRARIHSRTRPRRLFVSRRRTDATGPSVGFHIYSAIGGTIRSQCAYKDGTSTHVPYSMERRATRARTRATTSSLARARDARGARGTRERATRWCVRLARRRPRRRRRTATSRT